MDDDAPSNHVSALDFHVLRRAFKSSVAELGLPEANWAEHAIQLIHDLTGVQHVDKGVIEWLIRK